MKKILLMFGAVALSSGLALAQCAFSGAQYQGDIAPTPGNSTTMTTCAYAGEYQEVLSVVSGNDYVLTYTGGASNYITIFDATFTAVAWGPSPLSWTATGSGTYYSQPNLDDGACGTDFACHEGTWENTSPPPPCPAEVAPWLETFTGTTDPTCWTQSSASGGPWVYTGNPDFGTNPAIVDHTNGVANNYAWVDQSGADAGVILQTPEIDVTALSVPELRFWIMSHNNSGSVSTFNEIHVEASDGLGGWTSVDVISGDFGFQWVDFSYLVSSYTYGANLVQFRFRSESGGDINDYDNDMLLDDVGVQEAPTCPAPSNLTLNAADLNSATFSWTPGLSESEWSIEYGAPGFTPGTGAGTPSLTTNNILETVSGLAPNQFYEIYVRAACSPGDTSSYEGPIQFNTFNQGLYMDWDVACPTGGFIDISTTGTDLGLSDDGEAGITMPFTFLYQGSQQISDVSIGNNGDIKLGTLTGNTSFNGNMNGLADGLYPWLDDLDEETGGVYYETVGTPGNQVFIVQWHQRCNFSGSVGAPTVTFQVQIEEATGEIYFVYDDPIFGGPNAGDDYGANADIGIAGPNQDINVSNDNPQHLTDNSCTHFFYTDCPNPVNFTVTYVNPDEAGITWDPGLATESNWTIIYGLSGFDPATSGTTITTGTNVAVLTGLDDISDYDVYIFADCNPGTLQSVGGLLGTFTTPPHCSDITGLNTATAVDSLFTDWSWTESSGVGTYPSTSFNVQYGPLGFNVYSGTTVAVDNNFTDTTFDATFLAGGVYEVYVQAVCGVDTSNFVGPVTFTMPLTNDSTCLAETLPVDGMPYSFDNSGATIQANETSIAPPTTGANTTDGWDNSNISFTTWFTFDAPASGSMYVSGIDAGFDGQIAIYEATDCADFATYTLVAANDDALDFSSVAPDFSVCGLTPGNTYYLMHDSWSTSNTGVYSISLREIVVEAGATTGILDACTGDTINLFNGMSGQDAGGVWFETIPTANFADSTFPTAGLAYQVFDFEYVVTDGCAADTSVQQVQIYGPSSAGNDGVITVCQNEPLNLLNGLSGNVDLGGTWYDPSNNALPGADVTASGIPGSFNYDYITDNGVCPADTANVEVVVSPSCDYANVEELFFGDMDVYPNPTNGVVNITNFGSTEVFSYEITDVKGSVIAGANSAINGSSSTEIDLGGLEMGIYMIRVYNDSAHKTFRIVLQ